MKSEANMKPTHCPHCMERLAVFEYGHIGACRKHGIIFDTSGRHSRKAPQTAVVSS